MDDEARDTVLSGVVGQNIKLYNLSRFTFASLKGQDAKDIHKNLIDYITKFSGNVRDIFLDKFLFTDQLKRLNDAGLLYQVFDKLHPDRPAPERHLEPGDGLSVRGPDPPLLGNLQRDRRGTLHAPRGHPPDRLAAADQRRRQADRARGDPPGLRPRLRARAACWRSPRWR
jgi:hypothetical protein